MLSRVSGSQFFVLFFLTVLCLLFLLKLMSGSGSPWAFPVTACGESGGAYKVYPVFSINEMYT